MDKFYVFLVVGIFCVCVIAVSYCVLHCKLSRKRDIKEYCYSIKCFVCGKRIEVSYRELERIFVMKSDFFVIYNGELCCKSCLHDILILNKEKRNVYLDGLKNV